jgi:hypothetical protein
MAPSRLQSKRIAGNQPRSRAGSKRLKLSDRRSNEMAGFEIAHRSMDALPHDSIHS